MGFTVQIMSKGHPSSSVESTWAVLLNHEHIMFVGTYQQCEDWLDLYGVEEIDAETKTPCDQSSGPNRKDRSRIAEWFNGFAQRRTVREVCQRTFAFLTDNSGHVGLAEAFGLAITMAAVYVMLTTWAFAWNRAVIYETIARTSNSPHRMLTQSANRLYLPCDTQSPDIACDLAHARQKGMRQP